MIGNERQYKITKSQLDLFNSEIESFSEIELIRQGIDPAIARAQRVALVEQAEDLARDINRYDDLRLRNVSHVDFKSIADLGVSLIEARILCGLSQKDLADRLGMKEQQIQRYEQERYQSASLNRIAQISGGLELHLTGQMAPIRPVEGGAAEARFDWRKYPIKEMRKRGWIEKYRANSEDGQQAIFAFFESAGLGAAGNALHKKNVRAGGTFNDYALMAWKARVLQRAQMSGANQGARATVDPVFINVLAELSADPLGPVKAVQMLRDRGIVVVFEDHLPTTHLDGAAMLVFGEIPVIGLTLRHDRLDNFWFVLFHELAHIVCHRERGLRDGFFDDETVESLDKLEIEADDFARNALIPDEVWKSSFVRFTKSRDQVLKFAKQRNIHPAIVAGRIRRERKDYSIFSDLVGQGVVRGMLVEAGYTEK